MTVAVSDATELLSAQLPVQDVLREARLIQLPGNVTVEIGELAIAGTGEAPPWSARIQRGPASIVLLSDADAAEGASVYPSAALIGQLSGKPARAVLTSNAEAVLIPAGTISGPEARAALEEAGATATRLFRIHGGDHLRFGLTRQGLAIPV